MLDSARGEPSVKHVDSSNPLPTRHPFQCSQSQQNGFRTPLSRGFLALKLPNQ